MFSSAVSSSDLKLRMYRHGLPSWLMSALSVWVFPFPGGPMKIAPRFHGML
jgi:hypothetical protein